MASLIKDDTCSICGICKGKNEKKVYKAGCKIALTMCLPGETPDYPNQVKAKNCPDAIPCCEKPEPEKVCPGDGLCKDCAGH